VVEPTNPPPTTVTFFRIPSCPPRKSIFTASGKTQPKLL
jgi:hypothetical protein